VQLIGLKGNPRGSATCPTGIKTKIHPRLNRDAFFGDGIQVFPGRTGEERVLKPPIFDDRS
jgi:hypothetical protein